MFCLETEYTLNKDINNAVDIIGTHFYKKNLKLYKINPFSTEESNVYTNNFMIYNSFITDGSSLDQVFNAILNGCSDITVIDSCQFIKYYYYFKVAALLGLNYIQFQKFLYNDKNAVNESFLDKASFEKIKPILYNLNYESYKFWCAIYDRIYNSRVIGNLFNEGKGSLKVQFSNKYLNNSVNYQSLKEKIKFINPKFINDNILNIEKYCDPHNVDIINICNVYDYIKDDDFQMQEFIRFVNSLKEKISDDGKMILYYNESQMNRNFINLILKDKIISNRSDVEVKYNYIVYKKTK